jgi:hypothetical protein
MGDVYDFAGTASFSLEGWINRGSTGTGYRELINKDAVSAPRNGWAVFIGNVADGPSYANKLIFERFAGGVKSTLIGPVTVASTWYHVVVTYDGSTVRMYVNGVSQGSVASAGSITNNTSPLRIGRPSDLWDVSLDGVVDEVAVYTTVLSATQVTEHYNAGKR